jgi:hypothetical protein
MSRIIARGLLALFMILGLTAAWGCGGGGGFNPELDTNTDGDSDAIDVLTDGEEDVPADTPMDTPMDVPGDTPGDTPTDVETDDGGGPSRTYRPFQALTSGGDKASSTNYELELFIAPVMPVGSSSSTNYNLRIGPAGVRVD